MSRSGNSIRSVTDNKPREARGVSGFGFRVAGQKKTKRKRQERTIAVYPCRNERIGEDDFLDAFRFLRISWLKVSEGAGLVTT